MVHAEPICMWFKIKILVKLSVPSIERRQQRLARLLPREVKNKTNIRGSARKMGENKIA